MASGRSSPRRRLATIESGASPSPHVALIVALIVSVAFPGAVFSQDHVAAAGSKDGAALLEEFLDGVETLAADFEQELSSADGSLLETASGSLLLRRPNQFRWQYEAPYEQLVVADGKNLWIYDVELEQVTVTQIDEVAASTPAMLLSGDRAVREGFTVVDTFTFEGLDWVRLTPELAGTDFTSVLIGFDGLAPRRLELVDGLNQVTRIALSNVVVNPELPEDAFDFEPPRGVDVIGNAE